MSRTILLVAVVGLLLAGACSDAEPEDATADPAEFAAQELEAADFRAAETTTTTTTEAPSTDPTDVPGAPINKFNLEVGDCYDVIAGVAGGESITTELECDQPHRYEVFHRFTYPADHPSVYPGESTMRDYALQVCYRHFESWVGSTYELSELDIDVIVPTRDNFESDASRYRGIHCAVERVDGEPMVGTSRGSGW